MTEAALDLTAPDGRYDRQELISWWDQRRLADARVLVVGAGALGNELVKNLALLGVGDITVVDMDTIENSNLARCVLFDQADEGRLKAEVVAERGVALNPDIRVTAITHDVRLGIGVGAYRDFDVVLGGLDNREARLHVNRCCWKTGTPWVDGAIEGLMGVMRVFVPPESGCYECTLSENDFALLAQRKACSLLSRDDMLSGKVPTTVTSASIVAGMQAQEAVKLLHADVMPYEFAGKGVAYNGMTHDTYVVTYPRVDECMSHDTYDPSLWVTQANDGTTLGDLNARAGALLGAPAVLDFEQDLITHLDCTECDNSERLMRPLAGVPSSTAICPGCGQERVPRLVHSADESADTDLLSTPLGELGLPPNDVITARTDDARVFFVLEDGS